MDKLVRKPNIWDLHVHTPYKYNNSANSFDNDDKNTYIDTIISIINDSENELGMISFTDHNYFDKEIYNIFKKKSINLNVTVIPGIEVDLKMTSNAKKTKHILFYFPEDEGYEKIEMINKYLRENDKRTFDDFVSYLFENGFKFAISPHAFKQGIRGIETEWNDDDTEKNINRIKMYSSQFFVFWESDKSNIPYAKEFIERYYDDSEQCVSNFSDSHDYTKFKNYLSNPSQYFLALNTFNGILMVGSEKSRILYDNDNYNTGNQKIKTIKINDQEIELSDRLNVIIGGRGKGKSILIDKIGYYFNCSSKISITSSRKKFLNKFEIKMKNFENSEISKDLSVKYLNQSYIDALFSDESSKKIKEYFSEEFDSIQIDDIEITLMKIRKLLSEIKKTSYEAINVENIVQNLKLNIKGKIISNDKEEKLKLLPLYYIDEEDNIYDYYKYIIKLFPENIVDYQLKKLTSNLVNYSLKKIIKHNLNEQKVKSIKNIAYKVVKEKNEALDEDLKNKNDILDTIKNKLISEYEKQLYPIKVINKLYEVKKSDTELKIKSNAYNGEDENMFYFIKYNNVEHPVEFARRILIEAINGNIINKKETLKNKELFKYFLERDDIYNGSYSKESIIENFKGLIGIKSESKNKIIHYLKKDDKYIDLFVSSPGTQTNSLMEYVLNQNSTIPLLIDQPEDNVDNESRYKLLTKWIKKMKYKRQIILVSHDANIVINGDAENIIIADCVNSSFTYKYGALEYKDNIEKAAIILDGGKNAIRRRMQKYGE